MAWALAGTLVGFGFVRPLIGPAIGLVGLVLATTLAAMHREAAYRFVPWLTIGAVVTVAVFVGAALLCTHTGCTNAVARQVPLTVVVLIDGGLAVLAERYSRQPQSSL
jgi:uncharacterized membrane protein YjfL (UPF0719 family)